MGGHISIPFLVHDLSSASSITRVGGKALGVSKFILNMLQLLIGEKDKQASIYQ